MTNERLKELFLGVMNDPTMENVESILKELCEIDVPNKNKEDEEIVNAIILITMMLRNNPIKIKLLSTSSWLRFAILFKPIIYDFDYDINTSLVKEKLAEFGYSYDKVNGELVKI